MSDNVMGLQLDEAEVEEFLSERPKPRTKGAKEVCICGHGIGRHAQPGGEGRPWVCRPGRQLCRCNQPNPVLWVSDNRFFASKTEGPGARHALARGILIAQNSERDIEMHWISEPTCARLECSRSDAEANVLPVSINKAQGISNRDEAVNVFACRDCRMKFGTGT